MKRLSTLLITIPSAALAHEVSNFSEISSHFFHYLSASHHGSALAVLCALGLTVMLRRTLKKRKASK